MIHLGMLKNAKKILKLKTKKVASWGSLMSNIRKDNIVMAPWCESPECEHDIKNKSKKSLDKIAKSKLIKEFKEKDLTPTEDDFSQVNKSGGIKSLCIPFEQPELAKESKCVNSSCKNHAKRYALFGKSF